MPTDSTPTEIPLYVEPPGGFKRRRLQNACDICRQKKSDSAERPGYICSNCIAFNLQCTHLLNAKKKGNASSSSSIPLPFGGPDFARKQITAILSDSTPYLLPDDPAAIRKVLTEIATYARSLEAELATSQRSNSPPINTESTPRPVYSPASSESKGRDYINSEILDPFAKLDIHGSKSSNNFYGKSSQMALLKDAIDLRKENASMKDIGEGKGLKRMVFWKIHEWQKVDSPFLPPLEFPEPDLMTTLIDLYFTRYNLFFPLLHRPTFETDIKQNLHLRNRYFGELVLAVCAVAARYSKDPRVYWRGSEDECSVGWKYFKQVYPFRPSFSSQPSIYEVQLICTSIIFLQSTSMPHVCWPLLSLGVRYAQGIGVHRRFFNGRKVSVQNELWKRAFWVLVAFDVYISAFLGRPRAANPADYDLDLPIACDDEFWENSDPDKAFRQPPGRPSYMEGWVANLKLLGILGFAQHHMFAVKKVEQWANITDDTWDEKVAVELDSALNKWVDEVPDHLRWNPHREDQLFFEQSSSLYCTYYWIQIQIHRPFISAIEGKSTTSGMSYSSLAVCANAARSCSRVLEIHSRRGYAPFPNVFIALYNSALVLLFNLWRGKRAGVSMDPVREMGDIYRCANILHMYEDRWQIAGRFSDIITELISVSDSYTGTSYPDSLKRRREDRDNVHESSTEPSSSTTHFSQAGVPGSMSSIPADSSSQPTSSEAVFVLPDIMSLFGLPLRTQELERLPVHFTGDQGMVETSVNQAQTRSSLSMEYPSSEDVPVFQQPESYKESFVYTGVGVGGQSSLQQQDGSIVLTAADELDRDVYELVNSSMWTTPAPDGLGDQWEDWDEYMSTVDDILFRAMNPGASGDLLL